MKQLSLQALKQTIAGLKPVKLDPGDPAVKKQIRDTVFQQEQVLRQTAKNVRFPHS